MDFHSGRRMPSDEEPLPTKRAMHIKRQPSALSCREAPQFNKIAGANAGLRSSSALGLCLAFIAVGVAQLGRSVE